MKQLLLAFLFSLIISIVLGIILIPLLKKLKAGQTILHYVKSHKDKNGTPTMGGLFFIISSIIIFFIFGGKNGKIAVVSVAIGFSFLIVGFLDDFIKIKFKKNEGLKPYQKIIFQFCIAIIAGIFSYINGITYFFIPFFKYSVNLGIFTIPFIALIFIAITNSVNLTDGLDGLSASVSFIYLFFISILIFVESNVFSKMYLKSIEYDNLILLSVCLIGSILGFLLFNVNKAKVFMGDTGSLSLGGFIGSISVFSSNSFFIPILGIMFVISSISVIIQVLHYKRTKERVFLMAPFHHHLQMKGLSESKIAYIYSLITCIMGVLSIIFYIE